MRLRVLFLMVAIVGASFNSFINASFGQTIEQITVSSSNDMETFLWNGLRFGKSFLPFVLPLFGSYIAARVVAGAFLDWEYECDQIAQIGAAFCWSSSFYSVFLSDKYKWIFYCFSPIACGVLFSEKNKNKNSLGGIVIGIAAIAGYAVGLQSNKIIYGS